MIRWFWLLSFLVGCTAANSPWSVDSIASRDTAFRLSRLVYHSQGHSPIRFEFLKMGEQVEAFLSLTHFRWPSQEVKLVLTIEGQSFERNLSPHEGQMRLRLPREMVALLIEVLQDGKKVGILLDGCAETLDPSQFPPTFAQFLGESSREGEGIQNLLQGPLP